MERLTIRPIEAICDNGRIGPAVEEEECFDCGGPAREDEGYTLAGQLVCCGCHTEAVVMARIEQDMGEDYDEDAVYSYDYVKGLMS